ncbi:MAG: DUF3301 domain-containing protein [Pseudoxanthomonas sp.]
MTPILLLIAAIATFAYWNAARAAAERATQLGRNACEAAGVLWLDQSVHADGLRVRRDGNGRLGFERTFRFEYSYDGSDRHSGRLVLRGDRLVSFVGPVTPTVAPFDRATP